MIKIQSSVLWALFSISHSQKRCRRGGKMFVQNLPNIFWTGVSGQISLGLGVPTNKSVFILRMLNTLYQEDGGSALPPLQWCREKARDHQTVISKIRFRASYHVQQDGKPRREQALLSTPLRNNSPISCIRHETGAHFVHENLMAVCLPPPHASFTFPMYIICH